MQAQTTKITKRAIKRRNRNKRRRKIRRQQKNAQTIDGKPKFERRQKKLEFQENIFSQGNGKWEKLCLETFQRLTSWQCEAELNFWKARAEFLQKENKELKQLIRNQEEIVAFETEEETETEQEEEVEEGKHNLTENCDVDPGYLEFIAITHKHREDLKRSRANILETAKSVD